MFVVVEGPDLSGKTTLSKKLATDIGYKLVKWPYTKEILRKCPDESGETFLRTLLFFKELDVVMDRGFISNFVYDELFERKYDNSYLYNIAKELRPSIVLLLPPLEVLEARQHERKEDFIEPKMFEKLLGLYEKHALRLMKMGWNIHIVRDVAQMNELSVLEFLNTRTYMHQAYEKIDDKGKLVEVYSNHHNKHLTTKELIFTRFQQDISKEQPIFDEDYGDILPRMDAVCKLLKEHPTHRGAVILNPKAEAGDCICLWHFLIRENILYTHVYIRSSDIDRKYIADVQMTRWLMEEVAKGSGAPTFGPLTISQGSAHVYLDN